LATAGAAGEAHVFEPMQGLAHGFFVEVGDGLAV
jgi:hypothetical protein